MVKKVTILILLTISLLTFGILFTACRGNAEFFLTFKEINDGSEYAIVGCYRHISGEIEIPSNYNGKPITNISKDAFNNCSDITKIIIPASIVNIEEGAFSGCSSLENIIIDDGNGKYYSKENCIIETDTTILVVGSASGKIPDFITEISDYAFAGYSKLTNIEIPEGVLKIGDNSFSDCHELTNIKISDSVTSIGEKAFSNCRALTYVKIPNDVTSIGAEAFSHCSKLIKVDLLANITDMGEKVFFRCDNKPTIYCKVSQKQAADWADDWYGDSRVEWEYEN